MTIRVSLIKVGNYFRKEGLSLCFALIIVAISNLSGSNVHNFKSDLTAPDQDPAQDYWPGENWRTSSPEEQGMDSDTLARMINFLYEMSKEINSITIIRNGYLVVDACFYPFKEDLKHSLNSCTKSILSTLVGIAINEGAIKSINDPVVNYFPDVKLTERDQRKENMTIRDLLTMATGLEWKFQNNISTNQMVQTSNWTQFVLNLPMREVPGQNFNYCNGAAHLLSAIIQKATGKSAEEYAAEKLQIGIGNAFWSSSPEYVSCGYSGIYMTPIDIARFGYLYLKKGKWNDRQIVPESWVNESTKAQIKADWTPLFPDYGYMWWINRFGGYSALGYGGQFIFILPELELVVVITGGLFKDGGTFYPGEIMEKFILPSVKSNFALEPDRTRPELLKEALKRIIEIPPAKPIPALPKTAIKISGRQYLFDNSCEPLLFWFDNTSECKVENFNGCDFKVGLDDVYRKTDCGNSGSLPDHNHAALKGRWLDDRTFQIIYRNLEECIVTKTNFYFENNDVKVTTQSNLGDETNHFVGILKK